MIWRTAMMSSTNVSGPTRKVMSRSSFDDSAMTSRANAELPDLFVETANGVVEQTDGIAHVVRRGAVAVGDGANLLHRDDDLLALRRLVRRHLENLVDHVDHPLGGRRDHGRARLLLDHRLANVLPHFAH